MLSPPFRRIRATLVLHIAVAIAWPILARQPADSPLEKVRERYTKHEHRIPMRDGVRLFTAVYVPKDVSRTYPILITRTPYGVGPYGADAYTSTLGPSKEFQEEGLIFVYQDARGRFMSEGEFQQVRPHVPDKRLPTDVDESSDTHDSIDWLLKHVPNHNGRVGMVGVSQPGFHVAASLMNAHPALKAASPQAPTADYYMGDDVYHNGAFMLAANFSFYSTFRPRGPDPSRPKRSVPFDYGTADGYEFFLALPPLAEVNARLFESKSPYFQEIVDHPNYDQFWQVRSIWKYATNVVPAVLNVGGWFDAEDPMGPLYMYRSIQKNSPGTADVRGHPEGAPVRVPEGDPAPVFRRSAPVVHHVAGAALTGTLTSAFTPAAGTHGGENAGPERAAWRSPRTSAPRRRARHPTA